MTDSLTRYETTFESTKNLPMPIAIGHGENADLVASFKDNGVDVDLTGFTARAIYQPSSKWGTDEWYECPCEIVDNAAIAHWGNTYDNGDNAVKLFMHLLKDGKVAYPAIYQIRLFETPGFSPSTIEPIPETIDFSQYTLVNAPWALQSALTTLNNKVTLVEMKIPYHISREGSTLETRFVQGTRWYSRDDVINIPDPDWSHRGWGYDYVVLDSVMDVGVDEDNETDVHLTLNYDHNKWKILIDDGVDFSEMMTVKPGQLARFYFSQTAFLWYRGMDDVCSLHVSRKNVKLLEE